MRLDTWIILNWQSPHDVALITPGKNSCRATHVSVVACESACSLEELVQG